MLVLTLIALTIFGLPRQSSPKVEPFDDHAIITPRRIERSRGRGEDRDTVILIRPVVSGLRPTVLKKIRKELELKKILGGQYVFYKDWMFDFDYRVTYNRNHILSFAFSWNAYFAEHDKTVVFNLRDGSLIKAQDLVRQEQIPELVKLIDQKLQAELEQMLRDHEGPRDLKYIWKAENALLKFTDEDLSEIAINDKGITFFYDPGFHHTAAWAEPAGRYFFTYRELKNLLKADTVVSQFVE